MQPNDVREELKRGRRALDNINEVNILQDWEYDNVLKKWYIKISITPNIKGKILNNFLWYVVVDNDYPNGEVKIYPDAQSGSEITFEHQSNNGEIEKNYLWRKGSLCLDSQLKSLRKYNYELEPIDVDERLFWNVQRAVYWINDANEDKLAEAGHPFELPQFNNTLPYFIFSEDEGSFLKWEKDKNDFGIVELDLYTFDDIVHIFSREFKTHKGKTIHSVNWGEYLTQRFENPTTAMWIMLKKVPVVNKWQAPNLLNELITACKGQTIDLYTILRRIIIENSHIMRDGNQHLLLLGFPIPEKIGDTNSIIHWQAIKLPVLSKGIKNGLVKKFRDPNIFVWRRDKSKILTPELKLEWLESQNWSLQKITNRGRLSKDIISKKVFIIGAGTIGASVSELLVRSGVTEITIMDHDILEIGNLSRHPLGLEQIGKFKSEELARHLNQFNPHVRAEFIKENFKYSDELFEKINEFNLIIDCTAEDNVLDHLEMFEFKDDKTFVSISIGFAARMLYLSLQKGKKFNSINFKKMILPWIKMEIDKFPDQDLPRDGTKCWSPVFPARYDDILLASSTAIKVIEDFIDNDKNELNAVYKQYSESGVLIGYVKVEDTNEHN